MENLKKTKHANSYHKPPQKRFVYIYIAAAAVGTQNRFQLDLTLLIENTSHSSGRDLNYN